MKTRIILLIAASAIATLSFTIASTVSKKPQVSVSTQATDQPVGGLISEDKL